MRYLTTLFVLLILAGILSAQTTIAYTSFEDTAAVGGQYVDTDDAATDHPLPNHDGEPVMNYTPATGTELSFTSYYYNTRNDVGLTDGDYVGITDYTGDVTAFSDSLQGFEFSDSDGLMELTFGEVDITGFSTVTVYVDAFLKETGWEADDAIRIWVVVDDTLEIDLLNTIGQDIDDLGIEGMWMTLDADLSGYSIAVLKISLDSNSGSENLYADNIKFVGQNSPLPTTVQFEESNGTASEGDGSYTINLTISNFSTTEQTTCEVALTTGDAADLGNYTTQSVTFTAGSGDMQSVMFDITDDEMEEGTENFIFTIQNVAGGLNAVAGDPSEFNFELLDNDYPEIIITEIHYNPSSEQGDDSEWEFFEIYNNDDVTVDLSNWTVSDGVDFTFPDSVYIAPMEFIVITVNEANYQGDYQVFQWDSGDALSNSGENVAISDAAGNVVDFVEYDDGNGWPEEADGDGPSLELVDFDADNNDPANWRASYFLGGTPGYFVADPYVENTIMMAEGWNMLSIPSVLVSMEVDTLFPNASSNAFSFENGYIEVDTLENGIGYWLKFDAEDSLIVSGMPVSDMVVNVDEGWNLIGPFHETVQVADIISDPAGIISSEFYGFESGYLPVTELAPGKGYWVKTSDQGTLTLNAPVAKRTPVAVENTAAFFEIAINATDGNASYDMMVGIDPEATDGIDADLMEAELPPAPPAGIFDSRMVFADGVTSSLYDFRTGDINMNGTVTHKIQWQLGTGTEFTATIAIPEVTGTIEMTVQDPFGGAIVSETIMDGETTPVVVTNAALTSLDVTIVYTAPIPVEFTTFAANVAGEKVELTWETATETNNKGFEVERSSDDVSFTSIGFVDGNGTSAEAHSYSFVDHHATSGTYYYRLKQVDFDGTYAYSNTVEVDFVPTEFSLGQNYPNPFNPTTKIKFALPVAAKVSVKVYNVIGQQVAELINGQFELGLHEVSFNASELSSGVYFYTIEAAGVDGQSFGTTKKMMLMK